MRTTIVRTTQFTYPDEFIFSKDNHYIEIVSQTMDSIGSVRVTYTVGAVQQSYNYYAESGVLFLPLNFITDPDISRQILFIDVSTRNATLPSFTCTMLNGKTVPNKKHGSTGTVYTTSDWVDIYLPFTANINGLTYSGGVVQVNIPGDKAVLDYVTPQGSVNVYLSQDTPVTTTSHRLCFTDEFVTQQVTGNDTFENFAIFPTTIDIVHVTPCAGDMVLGYYDTDGCFRELIGRSIELQVENDVEYYSVVDTIKNIPQHFSNKQSMMLKVGLSDIARRAYPEDIVYSEHITLTIGGDMVHRCSLEEFKMTTNGAEYNDYELTLKILA